MCNVLDCDELWWLQLRFTDLYSGDFWCCCQSCFRAMFVLGFWMVSKLSSASAKGVSWLLVYTDWRRTSVCVHSRFSLSVFMDNGVTRLFFCLLGDFHITSSFQHFAGVENYHIKPVFKVGTFWHLLMHMSEAPFADLMVKLAKQSLQAPKLRYISQIIT